MSAVLRALVRSVLARPDDHEWSIQGFGMLRCYLSKEVRLHIWNPAAAVSDVTTIHDHPWDFDSEVVCGSIVDSVYGEVFVGPSSARPTHREELIVCGPGGGAVGETRLVRLVLTQQRLIRAGESYRRSAEELHETRANPGTVSVVARTFREDRNTEHARVYVSPVDALWVSAEPRPATREERDGFIRLALATLEIEDGGRGLACL